MKKHKIKSSVDLTVATVVSCMAGNVCLSGSAGLLFWIDLQKDKAFSSFGFKEGALAWVYYAVKNGQVLSVLPYCGEPFDTMPKLDDVEV